VTVVKPCLTFIYIA